MQDHDKLTQNECIDLQKIMDLKYASNLDGRFFTILTEVDNFHSKVEITLQNHEQTFFYPVKGQMLHKEQNLSQKDALLVMIDYIDSYFEEFLREDENVFLPIDWTTFKFDGFTFSLRGQIRNLKSEKMADRLLEDSDPSKPTK